MTAGLRRVRRARRVGGMSYEYVARGFQSSRSLRCDYRATGSRLDAIDVGADVAAVEGPVAQSANRGPEVPLHRVHEPGLGHARRTHGLARVHRAIAPDDDVALEH